MLALFRKYCQVFYVRPGSITPREKVHTVSTFAIEQALRACEDRVFADQEDVVEWLSYIGNFIDSANSPTIFTQGIDTIFSDWKSITPWFLGRKPFRLILVLQLWQLQELEAYGAVDAVSLTTRGLDPRFVVEGTILFVTLTRDELCAEQPCRMVARLRRVWETYHVLKKTHRLHRTINI